MLKDDVVKIRGHWTRLSLYKKDINFRGGKKNTKAQRTHPKEREGGK